MLTDKFFTSLGKMGIKKWYQLKKEFVYSVNILGNSVTLESDQKKSFATHFCI